MMSLFICAMLFTLAKVNVFSEHSTCSEGSECIPLNKCKLEYLNSILFPCHNGLNLYCCPSEGVKNDTVTDLLVRSRELFPKECGIAFIDDKITGGESADLGQFPWMALLGYKRK
ncbi:uncharacterized protein LOC111693139 [Anoplophora glabripennis]|uniref:uncharacterized protein LOC111693139 n=1 Tax=Anoplophora glabripennis TaxID=217634 RepID=UPI000C782148|nr:uncharacterized protein LOC111693139 [Anoplophora glabripennis]